MAVLAASATRSPPSARAPTATANTAVPAAANVRSGIRRNRGPASRPTATEPAPWKAYNTPAYAGGRPRASSTTAYTAAPLSPASSIVSAPAYTSGRRTGEPRSSRIPAAVPPRRAASRPLAGSRTRRRAKSRAARANVTASSATTAPAPYRVNRPATREGREQLLALVRRRTQPVEVTQQPGVQRVRDQGRLRRVQEDPARAVHDEDGEERADPVAGADEEQRGHQARHHQVHRDQQEPARYPVGDRSEGGAREDRRPHGTHRQGGQTVRPRRRLDPDPGGQPHRGRTETGHEQPREAEQSRPVPCHHAQRPHVPPVHPPRPGRALRWPC